MEEIADVKIMIAQIEYFMDCKEGVFEIMRKKLDRQTERIQAEREEFERKFKEAVTA